ncbi:MAG TPA: winged helix-turn-helix domain-containing protein [Acidimicrobiales bacterium]|nr:winged helix-turn-helix domain-containing protein [Acidimicrobiales bacterium]
MARAATSLVAFLDRELEAEHGLRFVDFDILDRLATAKERLPLAELSKHVSLSRSGVRLRVRLLDASGLVALKAADRRGDSALVELTEAGARRHGLASATVARVVAAATEG